MKWTTGVVTGKTIWTDGLFTLKVKAPDVCPFEPGQFLQLGMDVQEQHVHRPYSVASPHGDELEFYIVVVDGGQLTPRLWQMGVGDQLDVSDKAAGSFTLSKTPQNKYLWLIATGTGLAPYIAMLRSEEPWNRFEKIVVVHGVRYQRDLSYVDEIRDHQQRVPDRLAYVPLLTREEADGVLYGRIPVCLDQGLLEEVAQVEMSPETCSVLLCGNPAMLDDMEAKLGERGMTKHRRKQPGQIVLERYW